MFIFDFIFFNANHFTIFNRLPFKGFPEGLHDACQNTRTDELIQIFRQSAGPGIHGQQLVKTWLSESGSGQ